jgi:DNA topoisomerase-3
MLTEADLITLMDKNGIGKISFLILTGTDATIHEHIKKIQEREYTTKQGDRFYPTTLGMALVKGYDSMEMALSLSKPHMRSQMEHNMRAICEGQKSKDVVIAEGVQLYREAFSIAEAQENKLFEVRF